MPETIIITPQLTTTLTAVALWTLPWKGWALWRAARRGEKKWFIALLIVNSLAILELIYLFIITRPKRAPGQAKPAQPGTGA